MFTASSLKYPSKISSTLNHSPKRKKTRVSVIYIICIIRSTWLDQFDFPCRRNCNRTSSSDLCRQIVAAVTDGNVQPQYSCFVTTSNLRLNSLWGQHRIERSITVTWFDGPFWMLVIVWGAGSCRGVGGGVGIDCT